MPDATQFRLDRDGGVPLGVQLARKLEALVAEGGLKPGDQLPSVRQLAALAEVNVNTVRTVYSRLEQQGVLTSEHGRGTFVRGERAQPTADREYRRELMRQIGELDRQVAYYTRHRMTGAPEAPRTRPAGQLLPATDLMSVRDELLGRVDSLRKTEEERLTAISEHKAARHAEEQAERAAEIQAAGHKTRGTASGTPRIVSGPGTWVLRWRS